LDLIAAYPKTSTKVAWAGYPLGIFLLNQIHQPTYSEGVVGIDKRVDQIRKNIQISGTVVGGYSGSPVIEKESGCIIGVVSDGPENAGIFMAVSFEHVKAIASLATS
jgi:V8-like Glu-specific endopeptidase